MLGRRPQPISRPVGQSDVEVVESIHHRPFMRDADIFYSDASCHNNVVAFRAVAMGEMYKQLDNYGCNKLASRFVVPVTAAMKGDGPAIFISAACVFLTQQTGVLMDASKYIFIMLVRTQLSAYLLGFYICSLHSHSHNYILMLIFPYSPA